MRRDVTCLCSEEEFDWFSTIGLRASDEVRGVHDDEVRRVHDDEVRRVHDDAVHVVHDE
jgi:hypothetical protein